MLRKEAQRRFNAAIAAESAILGLHTQLVSITDLPTNNVDEVEEVQRKLDQLRRSASEARREGDALSASAAVMDQLLSN
jgi:hypothetical protein